MKQALDLTIAQKAIFDLEAYAGKDACVLCGSFLMSGTQTDAALCNAINQMIEINDAFHIQFVTNGSRLLQVFDAPVSTKVSVLYFDNRDAYDAFVNSFAEKPLADEQLFDIVGIRLSGQYGFLAKLHHVIFDAWSGTLLCRQFAALMNGEPYQAFSYEDAVKAQLRYRSGKRFEADRQFFLEQTASHAFASLFPKKEGAFQAERFTATVPVSLYKQIQSFSSERNCSEYTFLFNVLTILFARTTDVEESFYIGTSIINRGDFKDKNTIGLFVNTVPVLIAINQENSFSENLTAFSNNLVSTMRHQRYHYSELLNHVRSLQGETNTLYDVVFSFQNAVIDEENAEAVWYPGHIQVEPIQIHIDQRNPKDGLTVHYDFRTDCFCKEQIFTFHRMFLCLLQDALQFPDKKIYELSLMEQKKVRRILREFNDTTAPYDKDKSVYDLFREQIQKAPQAAQIKLESSAYSFAQLDSDASKVDAYIRNTLGSNKQVIGVLCDRSYLQLAAIFGIVRGGNAYLPISPQYPPERIRNMLESSNCRLVIAQTDYLQLTENACCIDDLLQYATTLTVPEPAAKPEDILYVIYTSGSAGTPKGAMVSNRSAVNRIQWMAKKFFDPSSVVMLKTPYTFDVSVWEIFGFAMCGFSLYILPPEEHYRQAAVLSHIEKGQVTDLHFVPTVFEQFLSALQKEENAQTKLRSLRHVILSGEALSAHTVNTFRSYHHGQVTIHNLYGPAECTVDVTAYTCAENETDPVPIGKPIDNTQIYIVDKYMNPVPIGVTGELCVAGDNVGQGYLNQSELTKEKFIDNPYGEGKLYKTGDLASWREDGNIVFVGRNDFQVKINGQRVELGEIETALSALDDIESAAVVVRKDEIDRQLLCAFYTGKKTADTELRGLLGRSLPRYMIPQVFMHLEQMPLNTSGKIDRKTLLGTALLDVVAEKKYEAPANTLEEEICQVFCDVLHVDRVGRNDSFYDLGGTSLHMIQMLCYEPLSSLSSAVFMENPTPRELAIKILAQQTASGFLSPLYLPTKAEKAIVLFPYGGGNATAYTALVSECRKRMVPIALYFVPWIETDAYPLVAKEIEQLSMTLPIHFYSHCAGAVIALKLLTLLNKKKHIVSSYIAGANIPPSAWSFSLNPWHLLSDRQIYSLILRAKLPTNGWSSSRISAFISQFRANTDEYFSYFSNKNTVLHCPLTIVLSKKDIFTKNYLFAKNRWLRYIGPIDQIVFIDDASHYFQAEKTYDLINLFIAR